MTFILTLAALLIVAWVVISKVEPGWRSSVVHWGSGGCCRPLAAI
jgi:uncharacterized cupin superfamily protein